MSIFLFIPLIIVLGVIVYKLTSLNDKIDHITFELFGLKRLVEEIARQRDEKTEKVAVERIIAAPAVSREITEGDTGSAVPDVHVPSSSEESIPSSSEESIPATSQPVREERIPTPPVFIAEEVVHVNEVSPKRRRNIEKLVGENLFSKIGILALIIGVGFFVKFAIDNDWINQTYRTILGIVTGFCLWGIAYKLRESYRAFSSVLAGGGFAICYVSIAIGYNYYELMPSWLAFSSLVCLTIVMILISVKFDRRELAMVAIIGGYVAPFMSAGDNGSVVSLLAYTTLLNAAMFVVCVKKNWWMLSVTGCVITWLIVVITTVPISQGVVKLVFNTIFFIMFSMPLALTMWRDIKPLKLFYALMVTSIINMFAYTGLSLGYIDNISGLSNIRGAVPLVVAVLNILIYLKYYRHQGISVMQNMLLGSVIVFVIMSIVVQFSDPNIIAIFFAVIVLLMLEIYGRSSKKIFVVFGGLLSAITFVILNTELRSNLVNPTVGVFTTMIVCGLCFFVNAIIISRRRSVYSELLTGLYDPIIALMCFAATYFEANAIYSIMKILSAQDAALQAASAMIMGCLLFMSIYFNGNKVNRLSIPVIALSVFILMNCIPEIRSLKSEIFQWLSACLFICVMVVQVKSALTGKHSVADSIKNKYMAYYSIVGSLFLITVTELILRSASLTEYYSAGFSVALIINGAVLLTLGMKYKYITMRFIGLGMYGLLLLKLVLYDLWLLPMIGRIIVFILLGAVLLTLSFMYQRLRLKLLDKGESGNPGDSE